MSENGKIRWLELSDDVNEMIDLGFHISPDTWPPTKEQFDEEHRLRYGEPEINEHWLDDIEENANADLPF